MTKKILNLYVRAGTGAAQLAFNLTTRATKLVFDTAVGLTHSREPGSSPFEDATGSPPRTPAPEPDRPAPVVSDAEPEPLASSEIPAIDYDTEPLTPIDREAELVRTLDDEDEVVAESADPGAGDGAGATLQIGPPWEGYAQMNADAIITRIDEADEAELAVLELHEQSHKSRRTVLAAAERRLKVLGNRPRPT